MRKLLLLLCVAFAVVGFCYPCVIFPFTDYTCTIKIAETDVTTSYNFKLNGKVDITIKTSNSLLNTKDTKTKYYKLDFKNRKVLINDTKEFENAQGFSIDNIYNLNMGSGVKELDLYKNKIAMWTSVGIGIFAVLLIITIPKKHKN